MSDVDKEFPYRIAYDEAVRALSQQQSMIDSLRTRAGLLLSAAAITTSFLGAQALNDGGPSVATWLALAGFVGLSVASLAILWPHSLEFTRKSGECDRKLHRDGGTAFSGGNPP
jgi:hypothetical protein